MKTLNGKFAVVTGGTRGIGRAISKELARSGAAVLALYARNRVPAEELEKEARENGWNLTCLRGDLTDAAKREELCKMIKEKTDIVDILVHSAASGVHRDSMELTQKHLNWTFDTNVFSIHELLRELLPIMRKGGRVIGITSHGGTRVIPFYAAVGASKGALESLFRHYASELGPKGITVNMVCPGMILTDAIDAFPNKEKRVEHAISHTPTGRLTTVEEVAGVVSFLCSPVADQIVGQTIVVDGGKTLSS